MPVMGAFSKKVRAIALSAARSSGLPAKTRQWAGRKLARMGEPAAALWSTRGGDPLVLSWLGLHRAALLRLPLRPASAEEAVALVRSHAGVGAYSAALEVATAALSRWPRHRAQLLLPTLNAPVETVLPLLDDNPILAAALLHANDQHTQAQDLLTQPCTSIDAALLRASVAGQLGELRVAEQALQEAFDFQALRRVTRDLTLPGIEGFSCETRQSKETARITVIMPVRNVAALVGPALRSVLNQDHHALEVVVVDDASTDATASVLNAIAATDARVRLIRSNVHLGAYGARNLGLAEARSEFVTFHDGDDWSHPQKLTLQHQSIVSTPGAVASISDWIRTAEDGRFQVRQIFPYVRMNTSSLMFRRQIALDRAGVFDGVLAGADSEYLARLKLIFGGRAVVRTRRLLSFGAWRSDSLTNNRATGFSSRLGFEQRLTYWEAWNRWHADVFGQQAFDALPLDGRSRPFGVPPELLAAPG